MLKLFVNYLLSKFKNPYIKIGFLSIITTDCKFSNLRIGRDSYLSKSQFGSNVIIGNNVKIKDSLFNDNIKISDNCSFFKTSVGKYSYTSKNTIFAYVSIGAFCSIGNDVFCSGATHPINYLSTHPSFYSLNKQCGKTFALEQKFNEFLPIEIGNDVWIGAKAIIKGGVKIGNGAIIGAGAVVTKDVPSFAIMGGVPAKLIKFRFDANIISSIEKMQWWEWDDMKIQENYQLFCNEFPYLENNYL